MGAGKPGAQGTWIYRQIPPLGVTQMPSYGWPPYKGGVAQVGGARFWQLQICTIRGQSPRCCGPGCARESALDAGWHGFPKSSGVKPRAAARHGVPASHGASWRRTGGGGSGGSDPPFLAAGAPPGRVKGDRQNDTFTLPLKGGRSLHSDPCGKAGSRQAGTYHKMSVKHLGRYVQEFSGRHNDPKL